jgi:hypothetical protein
MDRTAILLEADLRIIVQIAIHSASYKNGAFKTQIKASTDLFDAMEILIDSPPTTSAEKEEFREGQRNIAGNRCGPSDEESPQKIRLRRSTMLLLDLFHDAEIQSNTPSTDRSRTSKIASCR